MKKKKCRAQELCGSRGGRPELPVPIKPYGLCGRKATLNEGEEEGGEEEGGGEEELRRSCLLYTSDAADER